MKITGTDLKKVLGSKTVRDGFFLEILAERISRDDGYDETELERGIRLESDAIKAFEQATGKTVAQVGLCVADDCQFIASSPDGLIDNNGKYTEAVEIKCLSSKNHVKAWLDDKVPSDYYAQVVQYFIVNDDLETLYFTLYDPRISIKPIHIIEVKRQEIQEDIAEYKQKQIEFLQEIENKLNELIKL